MNIVPCRDCDEPVDLDSRGCPHCARNLDAERAVAKVVRLAGAVLAAVVVLAAAYLTLRRG